MSEPDERTANSPGRTARSSKPQRRSRSETIFLGSIVAGSLLATVGLLLLVSRGAGIPSMGIAIFAATGVATLVYAFLGGSGDSFTVRGMKLAGAAAVFAIIIYLVDSRLSPQIKDMSTLRAAEANSLILLDEDMGARPILGGGRVRLREVTSLDGWLEGKPVAEGDGYRATHGLHDGNIGRPDANRVFSTIFSQQGINRPVEEVLKMSQRDWEAFLQGLPGTQRSAVGGIAFAVLETSASGEAPVKTTVFKGDEIVVRNHRGRVEAVLCVQRILDTRTRSGNPEVVVLTQGTKSCPARK